MTKARKAVAKRRAPRKPVVRRKPATVAPQAMLEPPAARYAAILSDHNRKMIVGIRNDGSLDKGEAFTTTDKAAGQFWDAFSNYCKASGIFPLPPQIAAI